MVEHAFRIAEQLRDHRRRTFSVLRTGEPWQSFKAALEARP